MQYKKKVIDLDTGQSYWLDLGDHRPVSEVANMFNLGPRTFRSVLRMMGLLEKEYDGKCKQYRHRLAPWAVESGLGHRHDNTGFHHDPDKNPFDVIGPDGIEYIRDHLGETLDRLVNGPAEITEAIKALNEADARRCNRMDVEARVSWLACFFPSLGAPEVAAAINIDESLVRRYWRRRTRHLRRAREIAGKDLRDACPSKEAEADRAVWQQAWKLAPPVNATPPTMSPEEAGDVWEDIGRQTAAASKPAPWVPDRIMQGPAERAAA